MKQPDGTIVLWDPKSSGRPLAAEPDLKSQAMPGTDTSDVARNIFEDTQGTRSPDFLTKLLSSGGAPTDTSTGGGDKIDYSHLLMALLGSSVNAAPAGDEGGQSVGATTPEGAGYSPAEPTTGEETSRPKGKGGKTETYAGGKALVEGMIKRGWTPDEAAGLAGNVHVESGFKPAVKSSVKEEQSYGFMQWNHERLQGLKNMAEARGLDWKDPEAQMDWIHMERTGESMKYGGTDERNAYKKAFAGGGSAADIASRFGRYVERPKDLSQSVNQRMSAATQYAKLVGGAGMGGGEPSPPANVVAARQHDKVPYTNQTIDQELMTAILGGGRSWA